MHFTNERNASQANAFMMCDSYSVLCRQTVVIRQRHNKNQ